MEMAQKSKYTPEELIKKSREEIEKARKRIIQKKETDPEYYWSVVRLRAEQGLKTE